MIYKEKIPSTDPRLNRHINHDSRSREYEFNTFGLNAVDTLYVRHIGILNQLQLGSCTGNAGIGDIATSPLYDALPANIKYPLNEAGAIALYSDAEKIDGGAGYPPEDQGSSGLSIAKALTNAGLISGYQHCFSLADALKAGSMYPFITGITWYSDMFNPDSDGRCHITGSIAGGHEIELSEIDNVNQKIWFFNSWGDAWGVKGRFYLTFADYGTLLAQGGDVTVLLPLNSTPAPKPLVKIIRGFTDTKEVIGRLTTGQFTCYTLEPANHIPAGTYQLTYTFMPSHNVWHYLLSGNGQTGVFVHSGNTFHDTTDCILLGKGLADINSDGEPDVISSMATVAAFEALLKKHPATLMIQ